MLPGESSRLTAEDGAALPGACLTPGESRARPCAQAPRPQIPDAAGWPDATALTACCPEAPTALSASNVCRVLSGAGSWWR